MSHWIIEYWCFFISDQWYTFTSIYSYMRRRIHEGLLSYRLRLAQKLEEREYILGYDEVD